MLSGGQSQVAGETPSGGEPSNIADKRDQCCGSQQTDSRDRTKSANKGAVSGHFTKLSFDILNPLFELPNLVSRLGQGRSKEIGDRSVCVP